MGCKRDDLYMHPLIERQRPEKSVELRLTVGAVNADSLDLTRCEGRIPQPDEVTAIGERGGSGCLGLLASLDVRPRGSIRNPHLELDQEFHYLLLAIFSCAPAARAVSRDRLAAPVTSLPMSGANGAHLAAICLALGDKASSR